MHCQKCGKKLKPGETFCSICGYYNSEDELAEESDNWDDISTGNEIEIEDDDDSEKWFDDDSTISDDEENTKKIVKKESFWSKKKREKEEKKAKLEIEKAARAEQKSQEKQLESERKEQEKIAEAEKRQQEEIAQAEKRKKLEQERQEREYKRALERQQKEQFKYKDNSSEYDEDTEEKFLKAYIGEDYKKIRYKNFNLLAALLNWAYVIYRKLYITGIFGLLVTEIVVLKFPKIALLYAIFVVLLIGFGFNKYYLFISKMVINNQRKKFEGSDDYSMEKILSRKGGVNVFLTLIIYLIFLIILFYGMFNFTLNKNHNTKFWEENTNNAANCISLTKTSYNYLPNVEINGQIIESTCKITTINNKKEFAIYMKLLDGTKEVYAYFQTEDSYLQYKGNTKNVAELEARQANGTLTEEEKQTLNELKSIQLTYNDVYEKAKEEDKLIKEKKNTKERANFFFTKEEITR